MRAEFDTTLPDFTAIDIELANPKYGSICSIALVRVRDSVIVDERHRYVWPPRHLSFFAPRNSQIHGIYVSDMYVHNAATYAEVFPMLLNYVGTDVLVAHNAKGDRAKLGQACAESDLPIVGFDWACTQEIAESLHLPVANMKLNTLAEHFGVRLDTHHDALEDARACAEIMIAMGSPDRRIKHSHDYGSVGRPGSWVSPNKPALNTA